MKKLHPAVKIRTVSRRGCGWPKEGGLYLFSEKPVVGCGKLPVPLGVCPCCGEGIRPSRAPRWLEQPERLWRDRECVKGSPDKCAHCPMSAAYESGPALLIWVGEKFYPKPQDYFKEALEQGISRRILSIPREFKVGETWVLLAHRFAVPAPIVWGEEQPDNAPGLIGMFRPTEIQVIVTEETTDEEIEDYLKRGLTPTLIQRKDDAPIKSTSKRPRKSPPTAVQPPLLGAD